MAETIDSVRAQTLKSWELIVVDNGMSDETLRIAKQYRDDDRVRLVRQENKSLGGAIDTAAGLARGRYYAVLDSDDLLMPKFCERTAEVLDSNQQIDVAGIDAFLFSDIDGQDQIQTYRQSVGIRSAASLDHPLTLVEMIQGNVVYYTAAIRAEAWRKGAGYACDTPKVEDLAMFLRMLAAGCDIRVLPERLARYRLREDSFSRDPAHVDAFESSLEQAFIQAVPLSDAVDVQAALDTTLRRLRFNQAMRRARSALLRSDILTARAQARRAFEQRPSARPAAVYAGLVLLPGVMRRMHPAKQRVSTLGASGVRRLRRSLRVKSLIPPNTGHVHEGGHAR